MVLPCSSWWSNQKCCKTKWVALKTSFLTRPMWALQTHFLARYRFLKWGSKFCIFTKLWKSSTISHGRTMAMAAMNMVSTEGFSGVSFHLRRCPQWVASVLCKKTPIFGSRRSKLDHLTLVEREVYAHSCMPCLTACSPKRRKFRTSFIPRFITHASSLKNRTNKIWSDYHLLLRIYFPMYTKLGTVLHAYTLNWRWLFSSVQKLRDFF
jgi:hypothetical protein